MKGFYDLKELLNSTFNLKESWETEILFPAFETNYKKLYEKVLTNGSN